MPTISETLADFVLRTDFDAIPAATREQVKRYILDGIGVALATTRRDFARAVCEGLGAISSGEPDVIGLPAKLALRDAVMMNGTLVHGLDYDDTDMPGNMHFNSFSLPCAIASASVRNRYGLAEMEEAAYRDPEVLALAERVLYELAPERRLHPDNPGEVTVYTADGVAYTQREAVDRAARRDAPLANAAIVDKFHTNAARAVRRERAERILRLVLELERLTDSREVSRALAA